MFVTDLPPELRYKIYTYWFTDVIYKPLNPINSPNDYLFLFKPTFLAPLSTFSALSSLLSSSSSPQTTKSICTSPRKLSDIYSISKRLTTDPWLTHALLQTATFHLNDDLDILMLQARYNNAASLSTITRISVGGAFATSYESVTHLHSLLPKLDTIVVEGALAPLHRVWDLGLAGFEKHPWARFVACLCVFAPQGVPGMQSPLVEMVLKKEVRLRVRWEWEDPGFGGVRRMQFDTRDWGLKWEVGGKQVCVKQVRMEELEDEVEKVKEGL